MMPPNTNEAVTLAHPGELWLNNLNTSPRRSKDMSISVVLSGIDGIVLSTDSRATPISSAGVAPDRSSAPKLFQINNSVGITTVGDAISDHARWMIEKLLVNRQVEESQSFHNIVDDFCYTARDDLALYLQPLSKDERERLSKRLEVSPLIFTLAGYNSLGQPEIVASAWPDPQIAFVARTCPTACCIQGAGRLAYYWIGRLEGISDILAKPTLPIESLKLLENYLQHF